MERKTNRNKLSMMTMLAAAVAMCMAIAACIVFFNGTQEAVYAEDSEKPDNGIPVVYLTLDESKGTIDAMNKSKNHSVKCYGTVRIDVPEGFHYCDMKDVECKSLPETEMEMRGRGNTSWKAKKKPYKIKLAEKTDVFGLGANKHWVLIANAYDQTLLKDRITAWLGDEIGMEFTPRGEPVDLVMRNTTGTFSKYLGSYYLSENVRVDKNRIEIDELKKKVTDPDSIDITGGYLIQNSAQEDPLSTNVWQTEYGQGWANHTPNFDPADDGYENEAQKKYIRDFIQRFENALMSGDFDGKESESYHDLMDLDSAANYWLVNTFCINGDGYETGSTYIYKRRDQAENGEKKLGKLYWGPLWDFDFAWNYDDEYEGFELRHDWITAMFADKSKDGFVDAVYRNWPAFKEAIKKLYVDGGMIDQYAEEVKASQAKDYVINPFGEQEPEEEGEEGAQDEYAASAFADDEVQKGSDYVYDEEIAILKKWIKNRLDWMDGHIGELKNLSHTVSYYVDGKVIHRDMVAHDNPLQEYRDVPRKEGYTFVEWKLENGKRVSEDARVTGDMSLYAKYLPDSKVSHADRLYFLFDRECISLEEVGVNGEYEIKHTVLPEKAVDKDINWTSSDESIATVNYAGYVRVKKPGRVIIKGTLRYNSNVSREVLLIVKDKVDPATSLKINKSVFRMKKGDYKQLKLTIKPEESRFEFIQFVPKHEKIVSVDDSGVIHAKRGGTTTVTVVGNLMSENDEVNAIKVKCKVIIPKEKNPVKIKGRTVTLKRSSLTKKSVKIARKKVLKIKKSEGKLRYVIKRVSGGNARKYFKLNKKTGKLTVKKGLRRGTYKIRIRVTDTGGLCCRKKVKTVNATVKVR